MKFYLYDGNIFIYPAFSTAHSIQSIDISTTDHYEDRLLETDQFQYQGRAQAYNDYTNAGERVLVDLNKGRTTVAWMAEPGENHLLKEPVAVFRGQAVAASDSLSFGEKELQADVSELWKVFPKHRPLFWW